MSPLLARNIRCLPWLSILNNGSQPSLNPPTGRMGMPVHTDFWNGLLHLLGSEHYGEYVRNTIARYEDLQTLAA